ncbi:MAG: ABC transporter substrate-binding protein [Rubrivivax sp.]
MTTLPRRRLLGATAAASAGLLGLPLEVLAQAARGGVLVIGTTQKPRHLNSAVQSGIATMMPAAQLFASPLRMDAQWKPQPYLAERWELSSDNRSVTLQLRKDALFHDGRPITAEDVKFSLEAIRDHHPFTSMYGPLNAVTVPDRHTAVVRLSEPHPALLLAMSTSLTPIIPAHVFAGGDLKTHPRNASPVGSGPFKLVEFKPGEHLVLERFDRFFQKDLPRLDRLIFKEYKDPGSLLLAFESGEVDAVQQLTGLELPRAHKVAGAQVIDKAAPAVGPLIWLAFNLKSPKLADKRVRQALSFAIDREFVVKGLSGGTVQRSTGPIATGSPFYSAEVERYDFNLAKAAQLLDAAGLKPGADGNRLALAVDCPPGFAALTAIQEYLKPALAKVGIAVTVRNSPDFPTWARRVAGQQFEATLDGVWNWGDPVIGVHRTWLSSNIRPGVIWSNTQSYANPRVDELLAAAAREMNPVRRKAQYKEFQKIVVDDCAVAFIVESTWGEAWGRKVDNPPRGIWGNIDSLADVGMRKA